MTRRAAPVVAATLASVGWSTLALQVYLTVNANLALGNSVLTGLVRYFGFFTVLTNMLAAAVLTASIAKSPERSWLSSVSLRGATAAYMAMVGLVYSLVLRQTWDPQGLQKLADIVLHDLMPPAFVLYWLVFWRRRMLRWSSVPSWLIYPLAYLGCSLIQGALIGWYPYPFLDAGDLGYGRVLVIATGITVAFTILCLVVVALDRAPLRR